VSNSPYFEMGFVLIRFICECVLFSEMGLIQFVLGFSFFNGSNNSF
jgi:hypothetical protein